ncbi:MAG: tRNA (adenosine(37)-N6)-threonylcarbamoyltransferase complex transferase subunit TsaD [Bacteroidetes bacterium]|nr:tRNA (adenosine(37)-N6)-threonylcarbamoyltransferase complex transferase subunit TsaD [Bacteroidota bacterium]
MTEKKDNPLILAIESSCDDTAAAVIRNGKMLANIIAGQKIHEQYGGVIPELASRAHQQNILPVVNQALKIANVTLENINAIAYTQGPGLMGSLLVGSQFAKGLSLALDIPTIGINHIQAHVAALYLGNPLPQFPYLCLLVSGGHTQIIKVTHYLEMEIIGSTIDDAAGEAFDKAAKMLKLPYPGGPLIDKNAELGNPIKFTFPMAKVSGYDYSFSGLKTSLLYFLQKNVKETPNFIEENMNDICASLRYNIVTILLKNLERAAKDLNISHLGLAGGVSANMLLRKDLQNLGEKNNWHTYIPAFEYCTDNAAMIAIAAHYKYLNAEFSTLEEVPFAR